MLFPLFQEIRSFSDFKFTHATGFFPMYRVRKLKHSVSRKPFGVPFNMELPFNRIQSLNLRFLDTRMLKDEAMKSGLRMLEVLKPNLTL
ncbi:hypothetical protein GCM10009865_03560 [Aeromicrobium ponti]|uniref:Uncharacterized protein n=1 Tax=Cytobacillus oceanisediminis TaxID=665099 RepID=A0A562K6I1_9BACI|nr:hypothetical protein IQ19_00265 [Cytobacillus oceanisediminis]